MKNYLRVVILKTGNEESGFEHRIGLIERKFSGIPKDKDADFLYLTAWMLNNFASSQVYPSGWAARESANWMLGQLKQWGIRHMYGYAR